MMRYTDEIWALRRRLARREQQRRELAEGTGDPAYDQILTDLRAQLSLATPPPPPATPALPLAPIIPFPPEKRPLAA